MNQLFKRLGALLLVFALVVGMLPVSVAAEGSSLPLTVYLHKTDLHAQWENSPAETRPAEKPANKYLYEVVLEDSQIKNEADIRYYWDTSFSGMETANFNLPLNNEAPQDFGIAQYLTSEEKGVAVKVHVDGLTQVAILPAYSGTRVDQDTVRSDPFTWKAMTNLETVYVGVPFELPEPTFAEKDTSGRGEGSTIKTVDTIIDTTRVEDLGNGKYIIKGDDLVGTGKVPMFTRAIHAGIGDNPYLRHTEYLSLNVAYPELSVKVNDKEPGTGYYSDMPINRFTITFQGVEGQTWTPDVSFNGQTTAVNWTVADGVWTGVIENQTVDGESVIKVGGKEWKFTVDTQTPALEIKNAYHDGDNTKVNLKVTAGASGVDNVVVNGESKAADVYNTSKEFALEIAGRAENVTVTATSNAGKTATAEANVTKNLEFIVSGGPEVVNGFIKEHADYKVEFAGLTNNVYLLRLGTTDGEAFPGSSGITVYSDDIKGKTMVAEDSLGRTDEYTFPVLTVDKDAPNVSVEGPKGYISSSENQNLVVTIKDAAVYLKDTVSVTYKIKGQDAKTAAFDYTTGTATIPVANGEELQSYTISGVEDALGNAYAKNGEVIPYTLVVDNTAPTVEVALSSNIESIGEYNGQVFLKLAPVEDLKEGEAEDVWVKVTVKDPYLKVDGKAATVFEDIFSAPVPKHGTAEIAYDFTAEDFAGNKVNAVNLRVIGKNGVAITQPLSGSDGVFSGLLSVDRRMPSENATGIPSITPATDTQSKVNVAHKTANIDVPLYEGNQVVFTATINDKSVGGKDSGLEYVDITVSQGLKSSYTVSDDLYTITVTADDGVETDEGALNISVRDVVGNGYTFTKYFAMDNKTPELKMTHPAAVNTVSDILYYRDNTTVTTTVEEIFLEEFTQNGEAVSGKTATFPVTQVLEIGDVNVMAKDKADHAASVANDFKIIVDKDDPAIQLDIQKVSATTRASGNYANGGLKYFFTVHDANLDPASIELKYTIWDNGVEKEYVKRVADFTPDGSDYTYSFDITNGQKVLSYKVYAKDYALREKTKTMAPEESILVDTVAPKLTVTRTSEDLEVVSTANVDYFQKDVTYTIEIEDANIDVPAALHTVNAVVKNESGEPVEKILDNWIALDDNRPGLKTSFTLADGEILESLSVSVQDAAGNTPEAPASFTKDGYTFTNDRDVVVDSINPKATLSFAMSEMVKNVELTGFSDSDNTGKVYFTLADKNGNEMMSDEYVEITATLTVKDYNLSKDQLKTYEQDKDGQWNDPTCSVNDINGVAVYTKTVRADAGKTADFLLDLTVSDLAGNMLDVAANDVEFVGINGITPKWNTEESKDGKLVIDLVLDYRHPSTGADNAPPVIDIYTGSSFTTSNNGRELYAADFEFNPIIKDSSTGENESSGLATVDYSLTDDADPEAVNEIPNGSMEIKTSTSYEYASDSIVVDAVEGKESNEVKVSLYAKDKAGNGVRKEKLFAVDTLGPRITGTYDANNYHLVKNIAYFNTDRVLTLKLEDINNDIANTTITAPTATASAWTGTEADAERTMTLTYTAGVHEKVSAVSKDKANNSVSKFEIAGDAAYNSFVIDQTKPEILVTENFSGNRFTDETENDYFDKPVSYVIKVTDQFLTNDEIKAQRVDISYTINNDPTTYVHLEDLVNTGTDLNTYEYTINLQDGQTLRNLTVTAIDNAGNAKEFDMKKGDGPFSGHNIVVDTTKPVVTVNRVSAAARSQTAKGYDFYNCDVTYEITVTDANLNNRSTGYAGNYTITTNGVKQDVLFAVNAEGNEATASFTVSDKTQLDEFVMQIKDAAGNTAANVVTSATEGTADTFAVDSTDASVFAYKGNVVVVDTTAPTAYIELLSDTDEGELLNYYTDADGVIYVKLKNPTTNGTDKDEIVTVTARFVVKDYNLTYDSATDIHLKANNASDAGQWDADNGAWNDSYLVNKDGSAVYTKSVPVKTNATGQIILNLHVADMAGNKLQTVAVEEINNTKPAGEYLKVVDGNVTGTVTLDRRQPTSGNDTAAPFIELIPSIEAIGVARETKLPLYNKSFSFALSVTDGPDNSLNAGLSSVDCELTYDDAYTGSFVTADRVEQSADTHNHKEIISINAGTGECNHFDLTVTATDNVGNTIVYVKPFAVDTEKPRVNVSYDNNDVQNEKYFKANRTATVTVEDINFNPENTTVETEIGSSGWSAVDGSDRKFMTTYSYTADGDYTFKMASTDLAMNTTANEAVTYVGVATAEFTIDKTAPIIELQYSPDDMSKRDGEDVVYYAVDQVVSVVIEEHNFRAGDVRPEFYVNRDNPLAKNLTGFTSNGDYHSATATYDQGNRYRMAVNYTDLAGNPADPVASHIFSVDKEIPVITITTPDMDNDSMNMVTDDLELSFEIKDEQENLKQYEVVITHLNNRFETYVFDTQAADNLTADGRKTITVSLDNIEKIKENDGLYTVKVIGVDYAGNRSELTPELVFSLNRFGSTFTTNDPFTQKFLTPGNDGVVYHMSVDGNLIFQEINPNRVFSDETMQDEGSSLTIIVNGRSIRLKKGTDYTVKIENQGEGKSQWYVYTYEINKSVFQSDDDLLNGRYSILIYGVDEAQNDNTNEGNEFSAIQADAEGEFSGKIEFVLDSKAPVIITTGIESGEVYNEEYRRMEIEISDSTPTAIQVYLNEELIALRTDAAGLSNDQPWLVQDEATGIYTLNVNEQDGIFASQNVRIEALDAAGNAGEAEVTEFHVSTSLIVRMINSVWFYVALVGIAGAVFFVVFTARKKKAAV